MGNELLGTTQYNDDWPAATGAGPQPQIAGELQPDQAVVILKTAEEIPLRSVRIYRAHNHPDIHDQVSYAMRTIDEATGGVRTISEVRDAVHTLADEPNYPHLLAYAETVRPFLSAKSATYLEQEIADVEDGILAGYSTRRMLQSKQIAHPGGTPDSGVSPYVSATFSPKEALGFALSGGQILVIDIPLSELDGTYGNSEIEIKGSLNPKFITATISRDALGERDRATETLDTALRTVPYSTNSLSSHPDMFAEAVTTQRQLAEQFDAANQPNDFQIVQQKHYAALTEAFPEIQLGKLSPTYTYADAIKAVCMHYRERLAALEGASLNISRYEYEDRSGRTHLMNEQRPDMGMALRLREIVIPWEARKQQRDLERAQRRAA